MLIKNARLTFLVCEMGLILLTCYFCGGESGDMTARPLYLQVTSLCFHKHQHRPLYIVGDH